MTARRVTTLFAIVAAVLFAGCSKPTEGVPQGASGRPAANPDGAVVIDSPKRLGGKLDCATVVPASLVTRIVGLPATADTAAGTGTCDFTMRPDGRPAGRAGVTVVSHPAGEKTEPLGGNTTYSFQKDDKTCEFVVAIEPQSWLRADVLLLEGEPGQACPKAKSLLENVFQALPGDH